MSDFFWCLFPEEDKRKNAFAAKKRDLRKKHRRFERERGQMMMRERGIKTLTRRYDRTFAAIFGFIITVFILVLGFLFCF
mgnify:CR=1 FL=1